MKRILLAAILLALSSGLAVAGGGLDSFLDNLNIQARVDMNDVAVKLSTQFGVPLPQVQVVIEAVTTPADAFMCFQLGQMARKPYQRDVEAYQTWRGKGWGVIAKSLVIKPGSPEFHALKRGDFVFNREPQDVPGKGKGKEAEQVASLWLARHGWMRPAHSTTCSLEGSSGGVSSPSIFLQEAVCPGGCFFYECHRIHAKTEADCHPFLAGSLAPGTWAVWAQGSAFQ